MIKFGFKKPDRRRQKKKPLFNLSKRKKLVLVDILTCLGFWGISLASDFYRYLLIVGLSIFVGILVWWSLKEDLKAAGWGMVIILPMMFSVAMSLFYFILPGKLLTRIIIFVVFGIGMYGILLTENIFSVSTQRTIQLLRAAQALGFLFSLITAFLLFEVIFSFYLNPFLNSLITLIVVIPICLQGVWSGSLEEKLSSQTWIQTFCLAFIIAQGALFISMWPVNVMVGSLALVTILYVGLGLIQQNLAGRLFKKTISEYVRVGVLVFIILLAISQW